MAPFEFLYLQLYLIHRVDLFPILDWAYEHFLSLEPARPYAAAYPFSASWIGATRTCTSVHLVRKALRATPIEEV